VTIVAPIVGWDCRPRPAFDDDAGDGEVGGVKGSSTTAVSGRFSKARIIAVEMLRGPTTGDANRLGSWRFGLLILERGIKLARRLVTGPGAAGFVPSIAFYRGDATEGAGDKGFSADGIGEREVCDKRGTCSPCIAR